MKEFRVVGKGIERPDALDKAMGKTRYVGDMNLPGMLYAGIFYSSLPHANIITINKHKSLEVPGVKAVLTAADIPGRNLVPLMKEDWPFLAENKIIYAGQAIALIVAETKDDLEKARSLICVDYEELDCVMAPEESLKPGAPQINPLGNLIAHYKVYSGDIDKGFSFADVVVQGVYETGYQEHAYLESQAFLAVPRQEGFLTVYGSMQCPYYVQNAVSTLLGLPKNKIQIIQAPTGGAFGGKEDFPSLFGGLAALAAQKTGKPVQLVLDRRDDIIMTSKRHPSRSYYRTGAKNDGTLTACEIKVYLDPGAYATLTPAVLWRCAVHCFGPYRIPHLKVDAYAGATNKVPCGAFRGFGTPKVIFAMERQMDKLARELNMDPLILREINCLKTGDTTATGQFLEWSVGLSETIEKARQLSAWDEKRKLFPSTTGTKKTGIGCSTFLYGVGLGAAGRKIDKAEARIQVKPDGSVLFAVGTTDMGQGMQTVLTQIVAEGLGGIAPETVHMLPVDSTRVGDSGPTVASRATYTSGNALLLCCKKILEKMKGCASSLFDITPDSIQAQNGFFYGISGLDPDNKTKHKKKLTSFSDLAEQCCNKHIPLSGHAVFDSPPTSWKQDTGQGKAYVTYSYATQIAEVEVDTETGEIELKDVWAVHDVGKAINPTQCLAQIEGGVLQGVGYALMEFIDLDEKGRINNPSFSTYIIPTSLDAPRIHPMLVEAAYPEGPYGAKGFGETPLMGMAGCIANAVENATGLDITKIPILPENILPRLSQK